MSKPPPNDIATQVRTGEEVLPDLEELSEKANDDANVYYD